jgi:hypothetical protein
MLGFQLSTVLKKQQQREKASIDIFDLSAPYKLYLNKTFHLYRVFRNIFVP